MKNRITFTFTMLLMALILLTSCNTAAPLASTEPTDTANTSSDAYNTNLPNPPSTALSTPQSDFSPNERTLTQTITSPHDLEITMTADKDLYKVGADVEVVVTVKNIGEDYVVPEGDVFSAVRIYYTENTPKYPADRFEAQYEFENGNVFKKGETITQKFIFPVKSDVDDDPERDNRIFDLEFTLFEKKVYFYRSIRFFYDPNITLDEIKEKSDKYMRDHFGIENLDSYSFSLFTFNNPDECYHVNYRYRIGAYTTYDFYELVFNYKTGEIIEADDATFLNFADFNVTDETLSNAEKSLLDQVNEYLAGRGEGPLTKDSAHFYIDISDGDLCLFCELIINEPDPNDPYIDHFHKMFYEVICEGNKAATPN